MKKLMFLPVLALIFGFAGSVNASTVCGNSALSDANTTYINCSHGNPENVMNAWGTTNSQLPHILPGQSKVLANGTLGECPFWFPTYCVDITATAWYQARWK